MPQRTLFIRPPRSLSIKPEPVRKQLFFVLLLCLLLHQTMTTLRANVCCSGCQKKIEKALHKIHGVEDVTFVKGEMKVIVTGEVDSATLIKQLGKVGKRAELWGASNGEREDEKKARGGLKLPNLKSLLFSSKKEKQKKDDDKADDDDHEKSSEPDASDGHEEEAVHGGGTQPATGGRNPYEPYNYGYPPDQYIPIPYGTYNYGYPPDQYTPNPGAMQQEEHRRRMVEEQGGYWYPPPAHWYGRPEAQGYGQRYNNMYESTENCSVMREKDNYGSFFIIIFILFVCLNLILRWTMSFCH